MRCCPASPFGLLAAVGVGCFVAGVVATRALDADTDPARSPFSGEAVHAGFQPEMEMDPEQMMEMMREWAEPTEHHKVLEKMAGSFDCRASFSMGGPEAVTATGSAEQQTVLGGRYVTQHFTMPEFMGQPFEGMGATGYDKGKGKYVSIWIDNFSTNFTLMEGEYDRASDTMTWTGEAAYPDGQGGVVHIPMKHVVKGATSDNMVMEFWEPNPQTGEMMQSGTINYTRRD